MGTRSLTIINDENGKEILVMYRQFDGYLDGHGIQLANFLAGMKLVNGIRSDDAKPFANGFNCLAAQIVSNFKKEPGGIYIYPAGTRGLWEDFKYTVYGNIGEEPKIKVEGETEENGDNVEIDMPASELVNFINERK